MPRKTDLLMILLCLLVALCVACSCKGDDDDNVDSGAPPVNDDADDDTADDDADDDTEDVVKRDLTMTLEYRNTLQLHLEERGDELTAILETFAGYGDDLLAQGQILTAVGEILRFPEAKYEIYTLRFSGIPVSSGPCGAQRITYRLTLTGQTGATERMGGIASFCGEDTSGRPERILRIVGKF